jgi:hypothetical protein
MGISSSARRSGWLGTVMVTCATFPSLTLGSRSSVTWPFWSAVTTVGVTVISFHRTFPLPFPSVTSTVPSGCVNCTTSANFSPGAIAGPLGRRLDGRHGSISQVDPHPQLHLHRRAPTQRQQRGHRQAHRRARARQSWSVDFGEKPVQWTESLGRIGLLKTQHGSAASFGEEFRFPALFMPKTSFCASFGSSMGESNSILVEEEPVDWDASSFADGYVHPKVVHAPE